MGEAFEAELEGETDPEERGLLLASVCDNQFERLLLLYTAGRRIEELRPVLSDVVIAYERFQRALAVHEGVPAVAPLGMGHLGDYERCMQLIGLCYLLHRRDLLPRIAALQDRGYAGEDTLYEELLDYAWPDRYDTDSMLHLPLYDPLVHAMYADTDDERVDDLQRYLKSWYPAFKHVAWHDGHLRIDGTSGDYFGYWAFEAGAVAYLCEIDDAGVNHMVYPKDLVQWARANAHLSHDDTGPPLRLRCDAGQPCPREGYWFTPAKTDSRRFCKQGELMPAFESLCGATIWQWDEQQ